MTGALVRAPTATMTLTPSSASRISSRAASASNFMASRAGARAPALSARREGGIAVSSPIRRRRNNRAAKASSPAPPLPSALPFSDADLALFSTHSSAFGDLGEGLEEPVQALYLVFLLGFLVVGAYLVVRQVSRIVLRERKKEGAPEMNNALVSSSSGLTSLSLSLSLSRAL